MKKLNLLSRAAVAVGLACVACCSVPFIAAGGLAAAGAVLAQYGASLALALLAVGALAWGIVRWLATRRSARCALDGPCNPNKA